MNPGWRDLAPPGSPRSHTLVPHAVSKTDLVSPEPQTCAFLVDDSVVCLVQLTPSSFLPTPSDEMAACFSPFRATRFFFFSYLIFLDKLALARRTGDRFRAPLFFERGGLFFFDMIGCVSGEDDFLFGFAGVWHPTFVFPRPCCGTLLCLKRITKRRAFPPPLLFERLSHFFFFPIALLWAFFSRHLSQPDLPPPPPPAAPRG